MTREMVREWDQTESCSPERSAHFYSTHPPVIDVIRGPKDVLDNWNRDFNRIVSGHYPGDPEEQERRRQLVYQDSVSQELEQRYEQSSGQERLDFSFMRRQRRWQIFIARDPESILNDPDSFRPKQPSR